MCVRGVGRGCLAAVLAAVVRAEDGAASDSDPKVGSDPNTTKPYVAPEIAGLHWVETFDGDVWSRWTASGEEKYNGAFKVERRKQEALIDDLGLHVPEEAKHYGAAVTFDPLDGKEGASFVVQFEVKFQDGLSCGGSYIKLYDSEGKPASAFKDDTRYVIMFGPDKCGATNKIHFILQHKSPKTGAWEEKHCKDPPSVPGDSQTHLYGLVIRPDNSFDILVDGAKKTSGNLLESMTPSVNPPKEIDDPTDSKPSDWVDEAKMDDPTAFKPDEWDEEAPSQIDDPKATKPSGWVDDAEKRIEDPSAKKPDDWDEDEDGEWEPPIIDNPACKVGCGEWKPQKIQNPAYKGKWHAPKIDNPAYKGEWKPRQIPNPDFFVDETPYILPRINAVGIDIWTMSKGIMFDNLVVATDPEKATGFADQTWKIRHELEELQKPKPVEKEGFLGMWKKYGLAICGAGSVLLLIAIYFCCIRGEAPSRPPKQSSSEKKGGDKKAKKAEEKDTQNDKNKDDADTKDEAEVVTKDDKTEGESKVTRRHPKSEKSEKPEGGIGDVNSDE